MRARLLAVARPRVLVMGAAQSANTIGMVTPENPRHEYWKGIPNITVEGTDYAGAAQSEAAKSHLDWRFVRYVVDAHVLTRVVPAASFDAVVCHAVLEHVRYPWLVTREIARALRPGGVVFLSTHQTFKLHGYPFDYFRFSTRALEALFEPALGVDVNASWYEHEAMYATRERARGGGASSSSSASGAGVKLKRSRRPPSLPPSGTSATRTRRACSTRTRRSTRPTRSGRGSS